METIKTRTHRKYDLRKISNHTNNNKKKIQPYSQLTQGRNKTGQANHSPETVLVGSEAVPRTGQNWFAPGSLSGRIKV